MILYVRSARDSFSDRPRRKIVSILETWRELGFEVELVSGGDVYGPAPPAERIAARKKRGLSSNPALSGLKAPLVHSVSEYRDLRHDQILLEHLREHTARRRPELIWQRASRLHLAPMRVARELDVPFVLEWIDRLVDYDVSLLGWKARAADRLRMQEAFRVVVVSERWKRDVVEEYGIPPERVLVSYNAVDADEFTRDPEAGARIRARMGIAPDALVVGFVGSYGWQHEAHLVPEAAAVLRDQGAPPVTWLMVGDGPHRARTDDRARELGVEDRVLRQGRVPGDEVPAWLSAMDAAVVPSSGGEIICPIKVPEYMAAGLAPVVAASDANREVVEEGRTGLLFRSGDAGAMAEAVARLAASPGLAGELGRAARQEVETRFSWREQASRQLRSAQLRHAEAPGPSPA